MNSFIIDRESIAANAEVIFSRAEGSTVIAVVKGRGYGFGTDEYVSLLHECGVRFFAVTDVSDALKIRSLALEDTEILMLRSTALSDELAALIENDIILTIGSTDAAIAANSIAEGKRKIARAHLKIDTGMGRYGFYPDEFEKIHSVYTKFSSLNVCGLYTHLTSAFKSKKVTSMQIDDLHDLRDELTEHGIDCGMVHYANSSYLFKFGADLDDAVRIGSAFTGRLPCRVMLSGLTRVGHLESNICEIRNLEAGSKVGYGGTFTAKRPMKIAIVPIGYSDGLYVEKARDSFRFRDSLFYILSDIKKLIFKKKLYGRLNGHKTRILGHIGMTHTVCDVTRISCEIGDAIEFDVNPIYVSPDIFREFI